MSALLAGHAYLCLVHDIEEPAEDFAHHLEDTDLHAICDLGVMHP